VLRRMPERVSYHQTPVVICRYFDSYSNLQCAKELNVVLIRLFYRLLSQLCKRAAWLVCDWLGSLLRARSRTLFGRLDLVNCVADTSRDFHQPVATSSRKLHATSISAWPRTKGRNVRWPRRELPVSRSRISAREKKRRDRQTPGRLRDALHCVRGRRMSNHRSQPHRDSSESWLTVHAVELSRSL